MPNFTNIQPSLVITETILLEGIFPSRDGGGFGDPVSGLGFELMFAGNFAPRGTALSSGQILSIAQNSALFSILGTTYGGNGQTTFALPDLNTSLTAGVGAGPGLTFRTTGEIFGTITGFIDAGDLPVELGGSAQPVDNVQESLAARYVINTDGLFPSGGLQDNTIGVVRTFYGTFDPAGTMVCDGRALLIADFPALYTVIGTLYGGDGVTTFNLPDLRGRTIVGAGQGPGLSSYEVGQVVGSESATLGLSNAGAALGGSDIPFSNLQPALAMHMMVATQGIFPSRNQEPLDDKFLVHDLHTSARAVGGGGARIAFGEKPTYGGVDDGTLYIGELLYFAGTNVGNFNNAAVAQGQILSIAQNQALFALLGTQYGGNGVTTFALPDFRGRVALGSGEYAVGTVLGSETVDAGIDDLAARSQTGDGADNLIIGGSGGDSFLGLAGADRLVGNGGDDTLRGEDGDDELSGGSGLDTLNGGAGDDTLDGGLNDDTLSGHAGADTLLGGDGSDQLFGGRDDDRLEGGVGNDRYLFVDAGDSIVEAADAGTDTVETLVENYVLLENVENLLLLGETAVGSGNALANTITGNTGDNTLNGDDGADTLQGLNGNDTLHGGQGDDLLEGGNGADTLFGNGENDRLLGGHSRDVLNGGEGNDVLVGGELRDELTGGAGADVFEFRDGDLMLGLSAADLITDFSQAESDIIDLTGVDAVEGTPEIEGFTFIGSALFSGVAGELRYFERNGSTIIYGDTDGDGVRDFTIALTGIHDLTATDLGLVSAAQMAPSSAASPESDAAPSTNETEPSRPVSVMDHPFLKPTIDDWQSPHEPSPDASYSLWILGIPPMSIAEFVI